MARQARRVETAECQGPGSFVTYRPLTVGEVEDRFVAKQGFTNLELCQRVTALEGWTDDDGKELPLPDSNEALRAFNRWEVDYLAHGVLTGRWGEQGKADQKNLEKDSSPTTG